MQTCYPVSKPIRSAVPTFEPVTTEEARARCGIADSNGSHDKTLSKYIASARESVEHDAMVVCCTGTYTIKRTTFGDGDLIELPSSLRPVSAITSITYTATEGTVTTLSSATYSLDLYTITPVIKLVYGYTWPAIRSDLNGITITATAGYATAALIPERIKHAVLLNVAMQWQEQMNELKERESTERAYERVINLIRQEVYA